MGGAGVRFGGEIPKQFCLLGGKPLYLYALQTMREVEVFDEIILVCPQGYGVEDEAAFHCVFGKATRQLSAKAGLDGFLQYPEIVLIHDAVRPFITREIILENLDAAIAHGAANTCIATTDTLVFAPNQKWIDSIPNREEFLRGQTPQTFRYPLIVEAHEQAIKRGIQNSSDDCQLVLEMGKKVAIVAGSEKNFKITSPFDLNIAETLLGQS